jgi:polar amino acid transport system substrate-binding protein
MSNAFFDAGFPWFRPDCEDVPDEYKCQNIVFSDPVFEALVLLFVRADEAGKFATDAAMEGKTLCRPKGFSTFLLNQHGRNWEKDGMVELVRPFESDECFEMLAEGEIDAIVINEFHGRKSLARLGLKEQVVVADAPPVSVQGLRVAVHKDHPDAEELVALVSDGIAKIQANGTHSEIVTRHLTRIWSHY